MNSMRNRGVDPAATGRKIARMRDLNGLSIPELSENLRCSQQTVRQWMRGESLPTRAHLSDLAELFGVYAEDLLCFRAGGTEVK